MAIQSVRDLKVYEKSYELAMETFNLTKKFPKEELHSLVDQLRRSSRSVAANIREGYSKRRYQQIFIRQLVDALGSAEEVRTWLDFSLGCAYISEQEHAQLDAKYDELCAMLYSLINKWTKLETTEA